MDEFKKAENGYLFPDRAYICMICGAVVPDNSFQPKIICRECQRRLYKALYPESINGIGGQGGTHR